MFGFDWKIYKHQVVLFLILLLAMFMCVSCASLAGKDDSPELREKKTYMTARKEFALSLEKYNDYYAKATPEVQAKWQVEIDPYFREGNAALNAWKQAIDNSQDPASQEQLFLSIKSKLLKLLVDVYGEGG